MDSKVFTESKMFWLGVLTFAVSLLGFAQGQEFVQEYPAVVTWIGAVIGVLTIVLRFLTSKPVVLKK